jgi:y4mF family transcriptional regulator
MIMPKITNTTQLGEVIRAERKRQSLTQEQLAALTGVGVRFLRELEHGKESCRIGLALQVMQSLGLDLRLHSRDETR